MFGFLKKKLKDAVERFTGSVKEEVQEEQIEQVNDQDISKAEEEILQKARDEEIYEEEQAEDEEEQAEDEEEQAEDEEEQAEDEEEQAEDDKEKQEDEKQREQLIQDIAQVQEQIKEELQKEEEQEDKDIIKETEKEIKEELTQIEKSDFNQQLDEAQSVDEAQNAVQEHFEDKEEIDEEIQEIQEEVQQQQEPQKEKKNIFSRIFGKKQESLVVEKPQIVIEKPKVVIEKQKTVVIEKKQEQQQKQQQQQKPLVETKKESEDKPKQERQGQAQQESQKQTQPEKKGFFTKFKETFTKKTLSEEKFEELFWELEVTLLENNVAVQVIDKIKDNLKEELTTGKVSRLGIDAIILQTLKSTLQDILAIEKRDIIKEIRVKEKKPYVICFVGINGSGKTTNLAKFAHLCKQNGLSVVAAACDTFRAAAIQQLEDHTDKLDIKLIKQDYGADAASVAFDAIKHAESKGIDVVLIDTAGRLHSNTNLMDELKKIIRVANPDFKIFVGEATTGNDCVEQATQFNEAVGIDASILAKADVDDKGGAAISLSHVTGKPILYLGVGQQYKDLEEFDAQKILKSIGL